MKHTLTLKSLLAASALTLIVGCHTSNTTLVSPVTNPGERQDFSGKHTEVKFSPKADILFIIDNSQSMQKHQDNLIKNINLFVDELGKDSVVDYQVAVTPIFDSVRYGNKVPRICEATGEELFRDNGTLLKPKAPKGSENLLSSQPANFIKRGDGFMEVLKATLNVGVDVPDAKCPVRGPEFEEYFTTIQAAIELGRNGGPNSQFYRGTDSYLVVIILSDTGDSSTMNPADVDNYIRAVRGDIDRKTFTIHAVTDPGLACSRQIGSELDQSGSVKKTTDLVALVGGKTISMCDPAYGRKLAKLGTELKEKITENMTLTLQAIPEIGALKGGKTLNLTLGGEVLSDSSWVYSTNKATNTTTITLKSGIPWSKYPGQTVKVEYVPVDMNKKTAQQLR